MKTLTKVSVVLALAGSLTSVMAATGTQTNSGSSTQQTNSGSSSQNTNGSTDQLNSQQKISIKTQIKAIEHASEQNRVKLVNAFKEKIQTMSPEAKQQAMQMYAHAIDGMQNQIQDSMNQAQGAMQGGMNQAQGAMQGGMNQAQGAMQGGMTQAQGAMQGGSMQGSMNAKNSMGY